MTKIIVCFCLMGVLNYCSLHGQILVGNTTPQEISISYIHQILWENAHSGLLTTLRLGSQSSLYAFIAKSELEDHQDYYSEYSKSGAQSWGGGVIYSVGGWQPGSVSMEYSLGIEQTSNILGHFYNYNNEFWYEPVEFEYSRTRLSISASPIWNIPVSSPDRIARVGFVLNAFMPKTHIPSRYSEIDVLDELGIALTANAVTSLGSFANSVITIDSQSGVLFDGDNFGFIVRLGMRFGFNKNVFE